MENLLLQLKKNKIINYVLVIIIVIIMLYWYILFYINLRKIKYDLIYKIGVKSILLYRQLDFSKTYLVKLN